MKPEDKAVVQQALDALEDVVKHCWLDIPSWRLDEINQPIAALRQLLEQPAPVQGSEQFDPKFLDDLKKLMGLPPYNESSNTAMGDGYFSAHLIRTHGKEKFDAAVAYLHGDLLYTTPPAQPAPVQEPDAWVYTRNGHEHIFSWTRWGSGVRKGWGETPLYITQPAAHRQWVGLDEDEVEDCARGCASNAEFARAIIAKLREKNAPTQGETK